MTENFELEEKLWWKYVEDDIRELLLESVMLMEKVESWNGNFHDYAFIVFPAAKAYEGFLKKIFLDLGFITPDDYYGKRFRVGKALNPNLDEYLREKESVYDKLVAYSGDKALAEKLWETWTQSRNLIFHWFPNEKRAIDFTEACGRVEMIIDAMDMAYKECKMR
jgi:hypothetical protein